MIHEDPLERARDEAFSMRLIRLGLLISILATTVAAFATIFGSVRGRNEKKFLSGMTSQSSSLIESARAGNHRARDTRCEEQNHDSIFT